MLHMNTPMQHFIFTERFGFIKKSTIAKLFLIPILFLVLCFSNINYTGISTLGYPFTSTKEDKVLEYVLNKNPKLDLGTAQTLATTIVAESIHHNISIPLILGIINVESGWNQFAISTAGAVGWMQVQISSHVREIGSRNLYDPKVNIEVGTIILDNCMHRSKNVAEGLGCYNGSQNDHTGKYAKLVMKAIPII